MTTERLTLKILHLWLLTGWSSTDIIVDSEAVDEAVAAEILNPKFLNRISNPNKFGADFPL